jgi:hypothetical protein
LVIRYLTCNTIEHVYSNLLYVQLMVELEQAI